MADKFAVTQYKYAVVGMSDRKDATGSGAEGPGTHEYFEAEDRINSLASQGWELVTVVSHREDLIAVVRKPS
jgi:hypothetical protein